jgi:hypothetical protein
MPLGMDLIYPLLFILKTQYEILLGLLFWDLANDLFNTRQSKRLFPLITAGGVLGGVLGSFGTPFLARTFAMDNLMFVYLGATILAAAAVKGMSVRFPVLLVSDKKPSKGRTRSSAKKELGKIIPLLKESALLKILLLLTLIPNVVIPIINYQFNFAVNETFATEGLMLTFFGYFRGSLNAVNFVILLFIGRVYGRWGLPIALMLHPFNYLIVFSIFLLRFDLLSAMYARISTTIFRTTINNPARAVLVGLFPAAYRSVVRPFLRGTVVRVGILLGSGFIMISEGFFHPRYLSILAIFFVLLWMVTTLFFKRKYSNILLDLISKDMVDLRSLEKEDVGQIFMDKKMRSQLVEGCLSARGEECVWYAKMLRSLGKEEVDPYILSAMEGKDDATKISLLSLISPHAGPESIPVLEALIDPERPELTVAVAKAASRLSPEISSPFLERIFLTHSDPEIRAWSIAGLHNKAPDRYREIIESWLHSDQISERRAGAIAAGESGDRFYIESLRLLLEKEEDGSVLPQVFHALRRLEAPDLNHLVFSFLSHPSESVRLAALTNFNPENDEELRIVVELMGDPSERIHDLARETLQSSSYQNPLVLIESLTLPRRRVREGLFYLLESMNIKDFEVFRFARLQLEQAYRSLAEAEGVRTLFRGTGRDLLIDHLNQQWAVRLDNILRVLATQDRSGQMRIIWRGLSSSDTRQRSNSLEALEDALDRSLSRIMMPLVENLSPVQVLGSGRRFFPLTDFTSDKGSLFAHLLRKRDWVTVVLALHLLKEFRLNGIVAGIVRDLKGSENRHVRQIAALVLGGQPKDREKGFAVEQEISIPEKILHLKKIELFKDLSVSELAAVASVTGEAAYSPGQVIIKEGESGDTMYLILQGEVSVIKGQGKDHEIELDRIEEGDYFGEMALFEDVERVRSATIRIEKEARLLVLHKQEFTEIVREYPQIALHICKELSHRIRRLHEKIRSYEK